MHNLAKKMKNGLDLSMMLPENNNTYLAGVLQHNTHSCKGDQQNYGFGHYHPDNFGQFVQLMKEVKIEPLGDLLNSPDKVYERMLVEAYTSMIVSDFNLQIQEIKFDSNNCNDHSTSGLSRANVGML